MSNRKTTKRALMTSVLAIFMCLTMLVGTTFAWFTDTASTGVNTIQAGTLDVALEMWNGEKWVSAEGETLDFVKAEGHENETILWEPGCTYSLPKLRIVNNGNLALKYKVVITGIKGEAKLNEAIEWAIGEVAMGTEQHLIAGASNEFTITGHMKKSAGNEYQGQTIEGIAITVYATQDTVESDSSNNQYDANATYDIPWDGETKTAPEKDSSGVYHITNAAEFVYAMEHASPIMIGYQGNEYCFGNYVLESNIDLGGTTVTGFANDGSCNFQGTFDGQGYTISNFVIDSSSHEYYGGLFGYLYGATVKNLNVTNATVIGQKQVGVLVGAASDNSTITNCTVTNSTVIATKKVGTIAGYTLNSTVTDCYAENCTVYCAENDANECGAVIGYVNIGCTVDNKEAKDVTVSYGATVSTVSSVADLKNALTTGGTYLLLNDIDVNNVWTTVYLSNKNLTIYGNGHKITNLNAPLLNFYGGNCTINNLTVTNSNITANAGTLGSGVILEVAQWANLYMNNCHVKNSKVTGGDTRAAALVGYWIGGGEIKNCSAENCEITVHGTVGGIVGHRQVQEGYEAEAKITNCSVKDCKLTSYDDSYRVGAIIGTASTGNTTVSGCTSTTNTMKQINGENEITRPADQSELYGRTASGGVITIN